MSRFTFVLLGKKAYPSANTRKIRRIAISTIGAECFFSVPFPAPPLCAFLFGSSAFFSGLYLLTFALIRSAAETVSCTFFSACSATFFVASSAFCTTVAVVFSTAVPTSEAFAATSAVFSETSCSPSCTFSSTACTPASAFSSTTCTPSCTFSSTACTPSSAFSSAACFSSAGAEAGSSFFSSGGSTRKTGSPCASPFTCSFFSSSLIQASSSFKMMKRTRKSYHFNVIFTML